MSNRNFEYVPLNADVRANKRLFKLEKRAYEGDAVLQSLTQVKQVAELYDVVIDSLNKVIISLNEILLGVSIEVKDTKDYTYTEGSYHKGVIARAIPQVLHLSEEIYLNTEKLARQINFLTAEQLQELNEKLLTFENKYIDMMEDYRGMLMNIDDDKPQEIAKLTRMRNELDRIVLKIWDLQESISNVNSSSLTSQAIQNPQSVSGGYSCRPYVSNRKFI